MSDTKEQVDSPGVILPTSHSHVRAIGERTAEGKSLRKQCSRRSHGIWNAPADRTDPIELLIESSEGRVPELVPIRYGRMMASPFAFFRGAAAIMASDLSHTSSTGSALQICGDCHCLNFGGFATPERKVAFDINDFDETSVGPWEWDVKRLTPSLVLAGRANGFDAADCREAAWRAARGYRLAMAEYASMPVLDAWYSMLELDAIIDESGDTAQAAFARKRLQKASDSHARDKEFAKLAYQAGDRPRIKDSPPLIYHPAGAEGEEFRKDAEVSLESYKATLPPERRILFERYALVDSAMKVVGVGSVGTRCGVALLMSGNGEALFLQFKEARRSVVERYAGASPYAHPGERVVRGQLLMQAASDIFLGWTTGPSGTHLFMRRLSDAKIKPMVETFSASTLKFYGEVCGRALARAHSRSGDAVLLAGYLGQSDVFEDAMSEWGVAYADQTERDHAELVKAVRSSRLEAIVESG